MEFRRDAPTDREAIGWVKFCIRYGEPALILLPLPVREKRSKDCPLSLRELEILHCASNGMNMKTTAKALSLSGLTVKSHLARIAKRLGTDGDKSKMVAIAIRSGWID